MSNPFDEDDKPISPEKDAQDADRQEDFPASASRGDRETVSR